MPFGLKNAGATYQRLMDKVFRHQIGRNMEIYVDDMVAKTTQEKSHCDDLREIFEQIRAYNMRLNPEKCTFGVQGGKFLIFMLTSRGIEANPKKCEVILNMVSPKTIKEVQQLAGKVAALSRFLPVASSRSYHFFQTISKNKKFQWTEECEKAFTKLKTILSSPPVLQRPESHAINGAKVSKDRTASFNTCNNSKKTQVLLPKPHDNNKDKPAIETNTDKTRVGWASEQMVHRALGIRYPISTKVGLESTDPSRLYFGTNPERLNKHWELHVDGASSREGSGAGIILKEGDKVVAEQSLQFHFPASNNQAEYEALIAGLKLALSLQVQSLTAHCDSLLVVQQIRGEFQVKDPLLERYWLIAKDLISKFSTFIIPHVHREKNVRADVLSKLASTRADTQASALSQLTLKKPSIETLSITSINHLRDWRTPFLEYINTGTVPRDELNPQHFRRKASLYTNIAGDLYR
ncbi:uncharacterized protein LOC107641047 [Arachis ipaensis]|uniref:uncharacterized protein LOC107641047 n=1 Tax=Arachis ipaensis TaxID=130454 RepID=UPI0007AF6E1A|nr:uncharacterized protein LOC107641047 [Arachis ipaensis]XP_025653034.1 uncharacterized protein LOC112748987 [Arachis hypogaea]